MAIHNLLAHVLTCKNGISWLAQEEKAVKLLIKSLDRNEKEMGITFNANPKVFDQELCNVYLKESNFSKNFNDKLEFNDGILNFNYKFYQNSLDSNG